MSFFFKLAKVVLIILIVVLVLNVILDRVFLKSKVTFGATFSPQYAKYLRLDWQKIFIKMLDETNIKNLRLPTYWEEVEKDQDIFDFSDLDFMLNEAGKRNAKVIMVLGERQPRWPECHIPVWAKALTVPDRQKRLLHFMDQIIQKYKDNPQIWAWQIENEPMLKAFGEGCDIPNRSFLMSEVDLVRSFSNKPIIMTDSGELGAWVTSMQLSDIFGTTIYRQVYDKALGYVTYPIPPYFYNIKSSVIRNIFARTNQKTIIAELQAEPWLSGGNFLSADKQAKIFTTKDFQDYVNFAERTGFDESYLWGVEWWYWMSQNGHPEYLEYAKTLFK